MYSVSSCLYPKNNWHLYHSLQKPGNIFLFYLTFSWIFILFLSYFIFSQYLYILFKLLHLICFTSDLTSVCFSFFSPCHYISKAESTSHRGLLKRKTQTLRCCCCTSHLHTHAVLTQAPEKSLQLIKEVRTNDERLRKQIATIVCRCNYRVN